MLRLGKLADYGLLITRLLAEQSGQLTTGEIVRETRIPLPTVRKLLKFLVDAGVVESSRGLKGGYRLAADPADISIVEVIQAIDGPIAITDCNKEGACCDLVDSCDLRDNWKFINGILIEQLQQISINDMRKNLKKADIATIASIAL
jgi:FeS assembly SUF system regulator